VFVLTDGHRERFNGRSAGMQIHRTGVRGYVIVIVVGGWGDVFPQHCNVKPEEHTLCGTTGAKLRAR